MDLIKVTDSKGNVSRYVGSFDRETNAVSKFDGGKVYLSKRDRVETDSLDFFIFIGVIVLLVSLFKYC
jgi:hypothetical protein